MDKKVGKGYIILLGIFLIALAFRLTTAKYEYLLGADPWVHYKMAELVFKEGNLFSFHSLLNYDIYPYEAYVKAPAGLTYLPFYFYKLTGFTGISFYKAFQIMPSILGALAVLPLYLLAKELYSEKVALFSSLLLAITPAGIERGLAGFYRGDVFMVFTMLFAFYFFVYSVKKNLYASLFAGVFLFLCAFVWDGWPFAFATLSLAFALSMITNYVQGRDSQKLLLSYVITCLVGLSLIYLFKQSFYAFSWNNEVWEGFEGEIYIVFLSFILASSFILLHFMTRFTREGRKGVRLLLPSLLFSAAIVLLYSTGYFLKLGEFIKTFGAWSPSFIPVTIEGGNILELQKPSLSYISGRLVSLMLLAPIGFALLFRKRFGFNNAFSLAFAISSVFVMLTATRFSFLASPAMSLLGAISISYILEAMEWRKVMAACILILLIINVNASLGFTSDYEPTVYDELYEGLTWLNKNTPEGSIILTWWSHTAPVQAIADRKTLFGTYPSPRLMEDVGKMFITSDEEKAIKTVKTLNADYLLVDKHIYELLPNYMLYSDEPLEPFNSTLFKLYRGEEMSKFKLVFDNDAVKIYEPLYNYTRIQDVRTERRFYQTNEEVRITANIRANEDKSMILQVQIFDPNGASIFFKEYNVSGNSTVNATFIPPSNSVLGTYSTVTQLYDPVKRERLGYMQRTFVVNKYKEITVRINAQARYDPSSNTLLIQGDASEKGKPFANQKIVISQRDREWDTMTDENGNFKLIIENPKISSTNNAFSIYTPDRSGFIMVFADIKAELVEDLTLSKYTVKRGENVTITYAVKNLADFPFEGYLIIDDVKMDNKSIRMQLFTEYPKIPYKINPRETVRFEHTFTISQDAQVGRYKIWRAMWDENLKTWVAPVNKEKGGIDAYVEAIQ